MSVDVENYLDAFGIVAPSILQKDYYRFKLARVVMTIHMMNADMVVKPSETSFLKRLIETKFDLDKETAKQLARELCDDSALAPDLPTLADYVKTNTSTIERVDAVREMWEVAVCDNELHMMEDDFAVRCAEHLGIEARELSWLQDVAVENQGGPENLSRTH